MWEFMTILGDALRIATFQPRESVRHSPHWRPAEPTGRRLRGTSVPRFRSAAVDAQARRSFTIGMTFVP